MSHDQPEVESLRYDPLTEPDSRPDRRVQRALDKRCDPNTALDILAYLGWSIEELRYTVRRAQEDQK